MDKEIFTAIKEEWGKLVPAAKYSTIYGLVLLLFLWIDKSLKVDFYKSLSTPSNLSAEQTTFMMANVFVFLVFLILILERLYVNLKMIFYRFKYPPRKLNKTFYVISFRGRVCLIDLEKKEIRWIKSWQTALDLDFIGEWTNIDEDITLPDKLITISFNTKDGANTVLKNYKYANGIHTQGAPGT